MKNLITFKRGDTLSLAGTYKVNGVATSISGLQIASQVRDSQGVLIATMNVALGPGIGQFTLSATAASTQAWPTGALACDIQFSQNSVVQSTETFSIVVLDDITK